MVTAGADGNLRVTAIGLTSVLDAPKFDLPPNAFQFGFGMGDELVTWEPLYLGGKNARISNLITGATERFEQTFGPIYSAVLSPD